MSESWDIAVIGGGAAGCVVAARLATMTQARVVLLEAGGDGKQQAFIDSSIPSVLKSWFTDADWQLHSTPQKGLNDRVLTINQGKVLGGGAAINAMMYVRGHRHNFEEWHSLSGGSEYWSPEALQRSFMELEHCHGSGFDTEVRGHSGPLSIRQTPSPSDSALAFLEGCLQRGYQRGDFNGRDQDSRCGLMQLILNPDGTRCSTARAFLDGALPSNLSIQYHRTVTSLQMDGNVCRGAVLDDGTTLAAGQVILCAGAFQTPALLMSSGIGDPNILASVQIPCLVPNTQIGRNLSDHMRVMLAFRSDQDPGPTEFLCEAALFLRSGLAPSAETDLQINFSSGIPGFVPPEFLNTLTEPLDRYVIFVPIITRPKSRGSVMPVRSEGASSVTYAINPAYLEDPIDLATYERGLEVARSIATSDAMKPYCIQEVCPGTLFKDADYLRSYANTIWHPVGTCSVGDATGSGACTPDFRVVGTDNVYVADASIIPTPPSGNPQAAVFAMANIAARTIGKF